MKKWGLVVTLAAALCAGSARASTMDFGLTGGMATFTGNDANVFKSGFMGGFYGDLWLTPVAAIGIDLVGNFHSSKDVYNRAFNQVFEADLEEELARDGVTGADVTADLETKASLIQFGVHGKLQLAGDGNSVRPFGQIGVGYYSISPKLEGTVRVQGSDSTGAFDETVPVDQKGDTQNKIGFNAGAGVLINANAAVSFGIGANLHHVLTTFESTRFFAVVALLTFSTTPR